MIPETSSYRPAALTGAVDAEGRALNDQGFAAFDKDRAEAAVREFLYAIGEDPNREGLVGTPERVARACLELLGGMQEEPAAHLRRQFQEDHNQEMVVVKDIPFSSFCEHHLLPFVGKASVAYIPAGGRICGLSKIARCVTGYAHRLQVQERLTSQIADAMVKELEPLGVMVVLEAEHTCMTMRGARAAGSLTRTSAVRGIFKADIKTREEALRLLGA
ncbi:MAG: GTP cyclohydrolase I FolE [Atopobiaceae bacterium]|jgi:GTP cyclohydrolase I